VPTSKQRREAAQRHLQRQLQRRAEQARRRRRNALISGGVLAVILVVGGILIAVGVGGKNGTSASASASASASSTTGGDGGDGTCAFTKDTSGGTTAKDVGTPPAQVATSGTAQVTLTTNFGPIGVTLDHAQAPCATASFAYLASKQFFDNTPCHRETDSQGLKVLQCGDPSGTGTGGPGYQYKTHTTGKETYKRGVVAMANSGQGFDGSQFFLVYGDSQLQPDYTVVGTIDDAGLGVLDAIAANGNNGANGQGDGAPNKPVTIQTATVTESNSTAAATTAASSTAAGSSTP
jgi:peptidyl-prolyl cis-trans isomerase B (cyclophilin B)